MFNKAKTVENYIIHLLTGQPPITDLPHVQPPGATLFVTFRLAGSIPRRVQQQLLAEAERVEKRVFPT